jgi:hypothetical protein
MLRGKLSIHLNHQNKGNRKKSSRNLQTGAVLESCLILGVAILEHIVRPKSAHGPYLSWI